MTLQIYDLASGIYAVAKRSWASAPTINNTRLVIFVGHGVYRPAVSVGRQAPIRLRCPKIYRFSLKFSTAALIYASLHLALRALRQHDPTN